MRGSYEKADVEIIELNLSDILTSSLDADSTSGSESTGENELPTIPIDKV